VKERDSEKERPWGIVCFGPASCDLEELLRALFCLEESVRKRKSEKERAYLIEESLFRGSLADSSIGGENAAWCLKSFLGGERHRFSLYLKKKRLKIRFSL
jgi:hypothetical protein